MLLLIGESWIGLDTLHQLTSQNLYQMKITMTDFDQKKYVAVYDQFNLRLILIWMSIEQRSAELLLTDRCCRLVQETTTLWQWQGSTAPSPLLVTRWQVAWASMGWSSAQSKIHGKRLSSPLPRDRDRDGHTSFDCAGTMRTGGSAHWSMSLLHNTIITQVGGGTNTAPTPIWPGPTQRREQETRVGQNTSTIMTVEIGWESATRVTVGRRRRWQSFVWTEHVGLKIEFKIEL